MMAGPAALFGKTGGYVIGYIAIAGVTAAARRLDKPVVTALGMAVGLLLCYGFGTAWFMVVTGTTLVQSLAWCVTPFILPDICKAACAYVLTSSNDFNNTVAHIVKGLNSACLLYTSRCV